MSAIQWLGRIPRCDQRPILALAKSPNLFVDVLYCQILELIHVPCFALPDLQGFVIVAQAFWRSSNARARQSNLCDACQPDLGQKVRASIRIVLVDKGSIE